MIESAATGVTSPMRLATPIALFLVCFASLHAQNQTGSIVFYREPHFASGSFKPTLFCDGIEVARIENGSFFQIDAAAGLHTCTVESMRGSGIEVQVVAGKTAYVHVEAIPGWKDFQAALANTTEDEYNKRKAKLKPLKEWSRADLRTSQRAESIDSADVPSASKSPTAQSGKHKDRHSGKFGDLALSVTKIGVAPAPDLEGRDELAVFVSVANTGRGAICADFSVTLSTTFGLKYHANTAEVEGFPPTPRMKEMLPGESAEGSYVFEIKHGVQPRALVVRLASKKDNVASIRCPLDPPPQWPSPWPDFRDFSVPDYIHLDIGDLPITPSSSQ